MIDTLYIHAGSHKTGTSSIQQLLFSNKERLLSHNIHVADIIRPFKMTKGDLSDYKVKLEAFEPLKGINAEKAIVSKENFSWIDGINTLKELKNELSGVTHKFKIIFYLRRQDSLAISQKQEGVKWVDCSIAYGHDLSALPKKLSAAARRYLDYESKLNMWAEVFGQENLIIRVFEAEQLIDGDAVRDFCNIFDLNPDDYQMPKRVNPSFTRASQLFLHHNRAQFKEGTPEKKLLVRGVRLVDKELEETEKLLPSREQAMNFYQQFVASNARLNERFNISPHEAIFSEDFSMYPQADDEEGLSEEQLHQMYAKIFEHFALKKNKARIRNKDIRLSRQLKDIALTLPVGCRQQTIGLLRMAKRMNRKDPDIRNKMQEIKNSENPE